MVEHEHCKLQWPLDALIQSGVARVWLAQQMIPQSVRDRFLADRAGDLPQENLPLHLPCVDAGYDDPVGVPEAPAPLTVVRVPQIEESWPNHIDQPSWVAGQVTVTSPWQQKCQRAGCTLLGARLCQCLGAVYCSKECAAADWRVHRAPCQVGREIPLAPVVIDAGGEQILGRLMLKQIRRHIGAVLEVACTKRFINQAESFLGGVPIATVHSGELNRQRAFLRRAIGLVLERLVRRPPGPAMRQVLYSELLGRTERMQKVASALIISKVVAYLAHPWWRGRSSRPMD